MPLSVPVAKHTNFFLTATFIPFSPSCSTAPQGSPLVWFLKLHPSVGLPHFGIGHYFPQCYCSVPLAFRQHFTLPFNLRSWKYTVGSSERLHSPFDTCLVSFPTVDEPVSRPLLLPAVLPWPDLPFSSVAYLNSFWGGIPKRMCALFVWLCFCECLFFSLWELVYTRNNIKWPHFSTPSSIPNASTQANANINHGAVSKIILKGHLQLCIAFYQWGNWGANMWKGWPMLHKLYKWLGIKSCLVTPNHLLCAAHHGVCPLITVFLIQFHLPQEVKIEVKVVGDSNALYRDISPTKYKIKDNIIEKSLVMSWSSKCLYKRKECFMPPSKCILSLFLLLPSYPPKCQKLSENKSKNKNT